MKTIKISTYPLKLKSFNGQKKVYDAIRKKYVAFTPEEFVRQNMVQYLLVEKGFKPGLVSVEHKLNYIGVSRRCDILVYNKNTVPCMIIECKAPTVNLNQAVIDQAAMYNMQFKVNYLVVTNGNETYCYKLDHLQGTFDVLDEIPDFNRVS